MFLFCFFVKLVNWNPPKTFEYMGKDDNDVIQLKNKQTNIQKTN